MRSVYRTDVRSTTPVWGEALANEAGPGNVLVHDGAHPWSPRPERGSDERLARLGREGARLSGSWKAYCFADEAEREAWRAHVDDLRMGFILDILVTDLVERGVVAAGKRLTDREPALLMIETDVDVSPPTPA
jgi:hypothetical protein